MPKHCPALKFGDWPEPDRIAWTAALAKGDRFRRGAAAHWSPATRRDVEKALCRWLGYLAAFEHAALTEHPVARLTEDRLVGYVRHLAETVQSLGRYVYLAHLLMAFRVMFPGEPLQVLKSVAAQLTAQSQAPRAKPWVVTPQLTALGEKLIKEAGHQGRRRWNVGYRDGLMLMLWPSRPLRLRTFAQIQIGKHLRKVNEEWRLVFEGPEMKSGRPYQVTLPLQVIPFLERYLAEVRPTFPGVKQHNSLWVGVRGSPLVPEAISRLIGDATKAEFGDRIPPHRFRHCAASTIAVLAPSEIGTAVGLLDHSSPRITHQHYILARGIEASRQYAKIVADQTPNGAGRSRRPRG